MCILAFLWKMATTKPTKICIHAVIGGGGTPFRMVSMNIYIVRVHVVRFSVVYLWKKNSNVYTSSKTQLFPFSNHLFERQQHRHTSIKKQTQRATPKNQQPKRIYKTTAALLFACFSICLRVCVPASRSLSLSVYIKIQSNAALKRSHIFFVQIFCIPLLPDNKYQAKK